MESSANPSTAGDGVTFVAAAASNGGPDQPEPDLSRGQRRAERRRLRAVRAQRRRQCADRAKDRKNQGKNAKKDKKRK